MESQIVLDADRLSEMFAEGGRVRQLLPGFELRPGQMDMLVAVIQAFNDGKVLAVEAGTGVGKSLAYGLPSLAWARAASERVVISSATINLQEQLVNKDLKLVNQLLGKDVRVALVKGRSNYLCRRRLSDLWRQGLLFEANQGKASVEEILNWARSTTEGSRSDLPFPITEDLWEQINSDPETCLGKRCPWREECFFAVARKAAEVADVLVVNHHLLCADLVLRRELGGWSRRVLLPPFERIILDEAHELEDIASGFLGLRVTVGGVLRSLSRVDLSKKRRDWNSSEDSERVQQTKEAYQRAFKALAAFIHESQSHTNNQEFRVRFTPMLVQHPGWIAARECFKQAAHSGLALASGVEQWLNRLIDSDGEEGEIVEVLSWIGRIRELSRKSLHLISEEEDGFVRWAEIHGHGAKKVGLHSAPLDVAVWINDMLYERMSTVILTSATLAVGNSFDFILKRIGVNLQPSERIQTLRVESPFDYSKQARLVLPSNLPPPDHEIFEQLLPETISQLVAVSGGRALVLFTAWKLMKRVYEKIRGNLEDLGLESFCQGDMPRDKLLEKFRHNESSVLFGTDSFWQGVDVVGPALSHVIIVRLPFDVPDDPLMQARMEVIQLNGENRFADFALPRAVLKLKQGFGRLIRSREDFGAVSVLDIRLVSRSYGKRFLDSLPPANLLVGSMEEVCDQLGTFFVSRGLSPLRHVVRYSFLS